MRKIFIVEFCTHLQFIINLVYIEDDYFGGSLPHLPIQTSGWCLFNCVHTFLLFAHF